MYLNLKAAGLERTDGERVRADDLGKSAAKQYDARDHSILCMPHGLSTSMEISFSVSMFPFV